MEYFEVKEGDETSECRFYCLLSSVSLLVIVYPASYISSVSIGYSLASPIRIKCPFWIEPS